MGGCYGNVAVELLWRVVGTRYHAQTSVEKKTRLVCTVMNCSNDSVDIGALSVMWL